MKKIFLYAGIALSLAACSSDDMFENEMPSAKINKGITFDIQYPTTMVETRGAFTAARNFFWFAEIDRLNVYAKGAVVNAGGNGVVSDWSSLPANPAVYKATVSGGNGLFTSIDDANMLTFNKVGDESSTDFIAVYPETSSISGVQTNATTGDVTSAKFTFVANNVQNVKLNEVKAPMIGIANNQKRNNDWESVGEKAKLNLNRIMPVVRFTTVANNAKYDSYLGKLKSITFKNATVVPTGAPAGYAVDATIASSAAYTYDSKDATFTGITPETSIKTSFTTPIDWKNDVSGSLSNGVHMSILPIYAKATKAGASDIAAPLSFEITYEFEKATLVKKMTQKTAADWADPTQVYTISLDIANDFDYIVTNNAGAPDALLVFKNNFSNVYTDAAANTIKWDVPANPAITSIKRIYSEVVLTDAEMKNIKNYGTTNLMSVQLTNQTSVPAESFTGLGSSLAELILPKVTVYNDRTIFSSIEYLNMNSYTFEEDAVAPLFFNAGEKPNLTIAMLESLKSMRPTFGYERTISFEGYTALTDMYLNKTTAVALPASCFKGTTALTTLSGLVEIKDAPSVFEGSNVPSVNVASTIIPKAAFKSAKTKDIKVGGEQIIPTEIGTEAFSGNTVIDLMDLSKVTVLGASAFENASAFIGSNESNNFVVDVALLTKVPVKAFKGTIIKRIQFQAATEICAGALTYNSVLKQVKFLAPSVKFNGGWIAGIAPSVDLFVNPSQPGIDGLELTNDDNTVLTFKSITKETTPFAKQ